MSEWLIYQGARAIGDLVRGEASSSAPRGEDYILPDERARQHACAQLAAEPGVDVSDVEIRVLSGELFLSGSVPDSTMKQRAEQLCSAIPGVSAVHNELVVK